LQADATAGEHTAPTSIIVNAWHMVYGEAQFNVRDGQAVK
jgi:hypothetical protein